MKIHDVISLLSVKLIFALRKRILWKKLHCGLSSLSHIPWYCHALSRDFRGRPHGISTADDWARKGGWFWYWS